jgi:hypothetical protein
MITFESFQQKRRAEEYNERLIKATEGYAELAQCGTAGNEQIFKVVINPDAKRTVCFIAGLHGNEPAGPLGALKFLEEKIYVPKTKRVVIIPLVNPTGWNANTRETEEGNDLNRMFLDKDLKGECKYIWDAIKDDDILMLHTLHEDPDLKEFYLYYTADKQLAEDIRELASKYFPIYGKSSREPIPGEIYKDKIYQGLVPLPHIKRGGIEDKVLEMGIPYITTETPGKANLSRRVKFTKEAMKLDNHHCAEPEGRQAHDRSQLRP